MKLTTLDINQTKTSLYPYEDQIKLTKIKEKINKLKIKKQNKIKRIENQKR